MFGPNLKINTSQRTALRGFSLVELLVALGVLTIISAALVFAFNFNRTKAQSVYQLAIGIRKASDRFTLDTACFPGLIDVLWNRALASNPVSNTCYEDVGSVWNGPYMEPLHMSGIQWARIPQYGPTAYVDENKYQLPNGHGGLEENLWLPLSVASQLSTICKTDGIQYVLGGRRSASQEVSLFFQEY